MKQTFADLGIPFPLFDAPAEESPEYLGLGQCIICKAKKVHCFNVDALVAKCQHCGADQATGTDSTTCRSCGKEVCLPDVPDDGASACYACLRAGRAAITADTELGMVAWEQAIEGLTHGVPGLERDDFELVPYEDDPEWVRARVPPELLVELIRTPNFSTWQGERWLFCCKQPMVYVGVWKEKQFCLHAPNEDGKLLFVEVRVDDLHPDAWGHLEDIGGPYMFRCSTCQRLRGNYDMD